MVDYTSSDDDYYEQDYDDFDYDYGDSDLINDTQSDTQMLPAKSTPLPQVITKESLLAAQTHDICRVSDFLSLKEFEARNLLIFHQWDVDRVLERFIENGKEKLYAEAGVAITNHSNDLSRLLPVTECSICFDDVSATEMTAMDCAHYFCNSCWTQHFSIKIKEGQSRCIRCMEPKCNVVCDDAKIRQLVNASDPNLAKKFDRFLFESYIDDNKRVKWCPSVPHCGNAIRVEEDELCEVECACGKQFCFRCLSDIHSPCSCIIWEMWSQKCKDESETVHWITVHTKPCPKCCKAVEKNGGCNLVYCVCGQTFCWLCGGATGAAHTWTSIANHSCGRYKEEHLRKNELAKRHLNRYIHYHTRYKAHIESLKLESDLKLSVERKISTLEAREFKSKDFSWIANAVPLLSRSRQILSVTYAFAYCMFDGELLEHKMTDKEHEIKKDLFEKQQQQFEGNIEKLSSFLLEKFENFEEDAIQNLRSKIIAVSGSTDNLCQNLYDCIENDLLPSLKGDVHKIAPHKSTNILRSITPSYERTLA
ncbi:probable E3 ubiquitin-protein ligase ARI1 [Mercurialis annua]|uniref:probable E3 ubiquitin-protein ligase ARI1 n=1 Tax=Mercurialis annua TaxID=3986 RepID=UPI00215DDC42|nr:probable E3 ubiquitin-protein ligase ARI1 [Mercurialis annua]XP_050215814.1 probable E3 ubiquitin-protein ligase ARI1 [Mercurialis annua]XP_050215825.1 probable E3 ubiquitin-protein ligase ARI1 [Mercurialis annua]XP_055960216.1 probable E3 ubiquitin-protein ligase ARI1 [Mercurialis annua]